MKISRTFLIITGGLSLFSFSATTSFFLYKYNYKMNKESEFSDLSKKPVCVNEYREPRIFDVFFVNDELDMLDIRLNTLHEVVDKFFIVESNVTFSGKDKELNYYKNRDKFVAFSDKIVHVVLPKIEVSKVEGSAWDKEGYTRIEGLQRSLNQYPPQLGDFIIISDLDEIPKPQALKQVKKISYENGINEFRLNCQFYYYGFQFRHVGDWIGSTIARYKQPFPTGQKMRENRHNSGFMLIDDACWHCTWCFDTLEAFKNKASSYSHEEHNAPKYMEKGWIIDHVRNGIDLFERAGENYQYIEDNKDIPPYVKENPDRFSHMLNRKNSKAGFKDVENDTVELKTAQSNSTSL